MNIKFSSVVIFTKDLEKMTLFYKDILQQEIEIDFGNCIGFKNGLSLWKLTNEYPIAQKLGRTYDNAGNNNLELCFETDDFEAVINKLSNYDFAYLHKSVEETWGQQTVRFYDPENNLVEIGETIACFVKRFYRSGMTSMEISKRTSVPKDFVEKICLQN